MIARAISSCPAIILICSASVARVRQPIGQVRRVTPLKAPTISANTGLCEAARDRLVEGDVVLHDDLGRSA